MIDGASCLSLIRQDSVPVLWYEAVKNLSDDDLDRLHVFLTTLCFGQGNTLRLDTDKNHLFNRVAADLNVDMREHWYPDEAFLKRRNKEQLAKIVEETGAKRLFGVSLDKYKKGEIVTKLAEYFKTIFEDGVSCEDDQKAKDWLLEAMNFPAIDPDAKTPDEEDSISEDMDDAFAQVA